MGIHLAACSSLDDVKSAPGHSVSYVIERPYQTVYNDVRDWALSCLQSTWLGSENRVDAFFDESQKKGEIRSYTVGVFGSQYRTIIDVEPASADASKITIKQAVKPLLSSDATYIGAANGNHNCPAI